VISGLAAVFVGLTISAQLSRRVVDIPVRATTPPLPGGQR
jgi:hypothetical protein